MPTDIPWGYGYDRVTAMPVDPLRLYVYWEVTDNAIAAARAGLGPAGERAWLNVRVYDITGRLFDGTNAHSYFDHRVERHERQWFFVIDKPTSNACAEVGLRSEEGYFVKIARSGRVDFPRNEPVGDGGVEWLSVRGANGRSGNRWCGAPAGRGGAQAHGPGPVGGGRGPGGGGGRGGASRDDWQEWTEGARLPGPRGQRLFGRHLAAAQEGDRTSGPATGRRPNGSARCCAPNGSPGPFTLSGRRPRGEHRGPGQRRGRGPLGRRAHARHVRAVAGRDSRRRRARRAARAGHLGVSASRSRSRAASNGSTTVGGGYAPGSSEWMMMGASERAWMGASELLYRGASELWLLGASEMMFAGASERAFLGGSEYRFRGASERRLGGATELRLGGATERMFAGAERAACTPGASERLLGGASERFGGASEALASAAPATCRQPAPRRSHDPNSPYPIPPRER